MPMGPAPLGFAYFVGVKFVGYAAAAYVLKKVYPAARAGVTKVGATRTAIGIGAGLAYGGLWFLLPSYVATKIDYLYLPGLLPVRIAEWLLLLHLFFDARLSDRPKDIKYAIGGSVWSYCLDAIGIGAAMVIPGGIWVC